MPLVLFADFQLPGIPATMALAVVALLGYLVGRQSRAGAEAAGASSANLARALADARQLEQLTDDMLSVTREALDQCRQLQRHNQLRPPHTAISPTSETSAVCAK